MGIEDFDGVLRCRRCNRNIKFDDAAGPLCARCQSQTECPKCGKLGVPLYRNRPKGQRAEFVCMSCIHKDPEAPVPTDEVIEISKTISDP